MRSLFLPDGALWHAMSEALRSVQYTRNTTKPFSVLSYAIQLSRPKCGIWGILGASWFYLSTHYDRSLYGKAGWVQAKYILKLQNRIHNQNYQEHLCMRWNGLIIWPQVSFKRSVRCLVPILQWRFSCNLSSSMVKKITLILIEKTATGYVSHLVSPLDRTSY
jgi:hypothetical protein